MKKLKLRTIIGYAIGDTGGNLYFSLIGFIFIFYLTEQLGLTGTLAGTAMMIGRVWDAVTDPIISSLSDRTTSKFGRRRPYIFIGALLLTTLLIITFSLPRFESMYTTFILSTLLFCLLNTAFTMVNIPYSSLQPELSDDYNEKTKISGFRMSFAILGTILAVLARPIVSFVGVENSGWTVMAIIMGSIMLISSWITVFSVKEDTSKVLKKQKGVMTSYKEALTNREFIPALLPWSLFVTGVTIIQASFLYYFKYIFHNPSMFDLSLFGLIFLSLISLPIWVKISKRLSKKSSYMIGMGIFTLGLTIIYFLAPQLGPIFTLVIITISGFGFSTHYIMPFSIIPDVIELDYAKTGIRREGVYYSLWNFFSKIGQAFAGLLIGITLDIIGFIPPISESKDIIIQSDKTLAGIAFLCGPIPILIILTGIVILKWYPINRNYYKDKLLQNSLNFRTISPSELDTE